MSEATFVRDECPAKVTAGASYSSGEVIRLADGRAGYVEGLTGAESGDTMGVRQCGVARLASASGTTFAIGAPVYWDASANQAVAPSATLDGSADFYVGVAAKAKTSGQTTVDVELNVHPFSPDLVNRFVYEFDTEDGEDETSSVKNEHVLIPAAANTRGLLILGVYGVITEAFGGASQDQGIVTVRDASNNTICTLTPTDGGADSVGDVIVGTSKLLGGSTGDAVKTVAAGEYVDAQVTQETSGSGKAGKVKVYVLAIPLV
jgi:predicted RecA/RadA family phage recombinase